MGWYGGAGARRVLELRALSGGQRAIPKPRGDDGLVECGWPLSCRLPVGSGWVTGVYLARLTGSRDGKQSFVPFVVREASRVLGGNWCIGRTSTGRPYSFTAPDVHKFPAQFYWDSCFHAIAWAAVDPRRARAELRTLLAAAEPDGFIGHTIFWDAPVRLSRRAFYNLTSCRDRMTRTIHPPPAAG